MFLSSDDCTPSPDDKSVGISLECSLKLRLIAVTKAKLKKSTAITCFTKNMLSVQSGNGYLNFRLIAFIYLFIYFYKDQVTILVYQTRNYSAVVLT